VGNKGDSAGEVLGIYVVDMTTGDDHDAGIEAGPSHLHIDVMSPQLMYEFDGTPSNIVSRSR